MKTLKIIGYSCMSLCFGSLLACMQLLIIYMMFIQNDFQMALWIRILIFVVLETTCIGYAIDALLTEFKHQRLVKIIKTLEGE